MEPGVEKNRSRLLYCAFPQTSSRGALCSSGRGNYLFLSLSKVPKCILRVCNVFYVFNRTPWETGSTRAELPITVEVGLLVILKYFVNVFIIAVSRRSPSRAQAELPYTRAPGGIPLQKRTQNHTFPAKMSHFLPFVHQPAAWTISCGP